MHHVEQHGDGVQPGYLRAPAVGPEEIPETLAQRRYVVGALATLGVLISTALIASLAWGAFALLGIDIGFAWCLVLGAVLAPTDPVAVLGVLKTAGVPRRLDPAAIGVLFVQEAVGGAVFGLAIGWVAHRMLRAVDQYQVEILITLAVVMGGYALAHALHLSGPIAMVVAGLLLGHHQRDRAMSPHTQGHLDHFWELVDELLNAVLFVLIGLELLLLPFGPVELIAGLLLIPIALASRFAAVGLPIAFLEPFRDFSPGAVRILTWGGLRGAISVALALSLPDGPARELFLPVTYVVVLFSLVAQGLTIGPLAARLARDSGQGRSDRSQVP